MAANARIPVFTAEATSPRPRTPGYIPEGGLGEAQQGLARSVAQIGKSSEVWGDINQKIQEQHNDNQTIDLVGKYEGGIAALHVALDQDPDVRDNPTLYASKFNTGVEKLIQDLSKGADNDAVRARFNNHVNHVLPKQYAEADKIGKQRLVVKEKANLFANLEGMETIAASPDTPDDLRETTVRVARDMIENGFRRGFIKDEVERDKEIKKWTENTLKKNMAMIGEKSLKEHGDLFDLRTRIDNHEYDRVPEFDRLNIYDKLVKQEESIQTKAKVKFEGDRRVLLDNLKDSAINKDLPQSVIDEIKKGGYAQWGIHAEDALHLEKLQNGAETTEGDNEIYSIMQKWGVSNHTSLDTEQARRALRKIEQNLAAEGKVNKKLIEYGNMLNSSSVQNEHLAAWRKAADIKAATEKLTMDKPVPPTIEILPGRAKQRADTVEKEINRLKTLMRGDPANNIRPMSGDEALQQVRKERGEADDRGRKNNPNAPSYNPQAPPNSLMEKIDKIEMERKGLTK